MSANFVQYQQDIVSDVASCFDSLQCQPILFIGSGIPLRYFGAPNWMTLLEHLSDFCPAVGRPFAYYRQKFANPIDIGEELAKSYLEWAWGDGRNNFPDSLFGAEVHSHDFIKHCAAKRVESFIPEELSSISNASTLGELALLQRIAPHAIITTNYDTFLDKLYPDYTAVIGETLLRSGYASVGEIYKIHGCTSRPSSLVLTRTDYENFVSKRKYLSAKLLTYFAEHPLLFIGYSASDPNITHILSDIDLILSAEGQLIPNIYLLQWRDVVGPEEYPQREHIVDVGNGRSVRIKGITASDFQWVFEAFCSQSTIGKVNVKLLRSLLARTCEIVRHDIPRRTIQVDFQALEHVIENAENLANVLGIQTVANASLINADFPFTITDVSKKLGNKSWHKAHRLLERVKAEKGVDLKASDNKYHIAIRVGVSHMHKYSQWMIELLQKVDAGQPYEI